MVTLDIGTPVTFHQIPQPEPLPLESGHPGLPSAGTPSLMLARISRYPLKFHFSLFPSNTSYLLSNKSLHFIAVFRTGLSSVLRSLPLLWELLCEICAYYFNYFAAPIFL